MLKFLDKSKIWLLSLIEAAEIHISSRRIFDELLLLQTETETNHKDDCH